MTRAGLSYRPPVTVFMRILIVKLGSIGDVVHTLPSLAAIRRALPRAEISWVVERQAAEILKDNPSLDHLIEVDTKALRRWPMSGETLLAPRQQLRRLRASTFDAALDFQGLFKSAAIARLSGARRVYGFSREGLREPGSRFLLTKAVRPPANEHIIVVNLALVSGALGITVPADPAEFEFPIGITRAHRLEAEAAVSFTGGRYAILNPGGGWPTKLWGAERFGALADELWAQHGLYSIVTYGPGEQEVAGRVINTSRSGRARAACLSLKGFFALAQRARLYVGGDTGPTHLAAAARAPVAGLFGPTEWWRNGSPFPGDVCIERLDIGCRTDCHRRSCSRWICMNFEVESVLYAVGERLRRANDVERMESTAFA